MPDQMRGWMGVVHLRYDPANSFKFTNEPGLYNHPQLPQFLPRVAWPEHVVDWGPRSFFALRTSTVDWADRMEVQALHDEVNSIYTHLHPMRPFESGRYDDTEWLTHIAYVHGVLARTITRGQPLEHGGMSALLRIISYGMFDSMTFFEPWTVKGPPGGTQTRSGPNLEERWHAEFSMYMVDGDFQQPGRDKNYYLNRMMGRRWIVAPINYFDTQWGMTIFDRQAGQLFIFDSHGSIGGVEQSDASCHLWARFWNWLGKPHSFSHYMAPVTRKIGLRDSGLAAVAWVIENLRNQVGSFMRVEDALIHRFNCVILLPDARMTVGDSSLPLHDWLPDGCSSAAQGMAVVEEIIGAMACNELGLAFHKYLTRPYDNSDLGDMPASRMQHMTDLMANRNGIASDVFWTSSGGPQFIWYRKKHHRPYDRHASRAHYRTGDFNMFIMNDRGSLTIRTQAQTPLVPPVGYTVAAPFQRSINNLECKVRGIDHFPEADTPTSKDIDVALLNIHEEPNMSHIERPVRLRIIYAGYFQQQDGSHTVGITISSVGDVNPFTQFIEFPLQ